MFQLETIMSAPSTVARNRELGAGNRDRCIACQRPLNRAAGMVHICLCCNNVLAEHELCIYGNDEDGQGGSGEFPLGSECVKRVPAGYLTGYVIDTVRRGDFPSQQGGH